MTFKNSHKYLPSLLTCIAILILCCSMGGSTEQGNAKIYGTVKNPSMTDKEIELNLVSEHFNPFDSNSGTVFKAKTDTMGNYSFESIPFGSYYLYARDDNHKFSLLKGPYELKENEIVMGNDTLKISSLIRIKLTDSMVGNTNGFYIKGSTDTALVTDTSQSFIGGVPSGTHDLMLYFPDNYNQNTPVVYAKNITVRPADTISISFMNRPPLIITSSSDLLPVVKIDSLYLDTIKAIDPDTDHIIYSVINPPSSFTIDSSSGIIRWIPVSSDTIIQAKIIVSDEHGATSSLQWNVRIKSARQAPTPTSPNGIQVCFLDSTYSYSTDSFYCASTPTLYRFSWGDGDTSSWSPIPSAKHTWLRAGAFSIRVQVQCNDFGMPSAWSLPKSVQVNKTRISDIPSLFFSNDTFFTYDKIQLYIDTLQCSSTQLYRVFVDDSDFTGWTNSLVISFTPKKPGLHEFRISGWCDTANSFPSAQSDPYLFYVNNFVLEPPDISGDSIYKGQDSAFMQYSISGSSCNGIGNQQYRLSVFFRDTSFTNDPILYDTLAYLYQIVPVVDTFYLYDTLNLLNPDTTYWGNYEQFQLKFMGPADFEIRVQAKCNEILSDWASFRVFKME
ncbi:MAG TPA: hypothetical protein VHP36_08980 [Chitinispirillaceae bacterium]|nr:hypothetical protein [Chitinispirillaceae bacterium]